MEAALAVEFQLKVLNLMVTKALEILPPETTRRPHLYSSVISESVIFDSSTSDAAIAKHDGSRVRVVPFQCRIRCALTLQSLVASSQLANSRAGASSTKRSSFGVKTSSSISKPATSRLHLWNNSLGQSGHHENKSSTFSANTSPLPPFCTICGNA